MNNDLKKKIEEIMPFSGVLSRDVCIETPLSYNDLINELVILFEAEIEKAYAKGLVEKMKTFENAFMNSYFKQEKQNKEDLIEEINLGMKQVFLGHGLNFTGPQAVGVMTHIFVKHLDSLKDGKGNK